MRWSLLLCASLASQAMASSPEAPFHFKSLSGEKDVAGVNENFRNLSDHIRRVQADIDTLDAYAASVSSAATTYTLAPSSNVVFTNSVTSTVGCDTGVPNSSATIITTGGKVEVDFQGNCYGYYVAGPWAIVNATMCMDGAEIPSFPRIYLDNHDANYYLITPCSRHFRLLTAPPAGVHSFYLAVTITGTASIDCTYGCSVEATEVR